MNFKSTFKLSDLKNVFHPDAFKDSENKDIPVFWHNDPNKIIGFATVKEKDGELIVNGYLSDSKPLVKIINKIVEDYGLVLDIDLNITNKLIDKDGSIVHADIINAGLINRRADKK